jgi:hypothetical protein
VEHEVEGHTARNKPRGFGRVLGFTGGMIGVGTLLMVLFDARFGCAVFALGLGATMLLGAFSPLAESPAKAFFIRLAMLGLGSAFFAAGVWLLSPDHG